MSRLPTIALLVLLAFPAATRAGGKPSVDDLRREGDLEGAALRAEQMVDENPRDVDSHIVMQDLWRTLGREKTLLPRYRDATRSEESTADDHYLYGRLLEGRRAERQFRLALEKNPRHFRSLCALGVLLSEASKTRAARDHLTRAASLHPESGIPVNGLGWIAERQGDLDAAEKHYRDAIDLSPDLVAARVNLGMLVLARGRGADAVEILEAATVKAPLDPMPLLALGTALLATGDGRAAVRRFEEALELKANTVVTLNLLANAYINLERHELAETALRRAIERSPEHVPSHLNLAFLHLSLGKVDEAIRSAQGALKIDARSAGAWFLIGSCHSARDDARKAEAAYRKACRLAPEHVPTWRALRMLYANEGRWKRAVDAAQKVVELTDESADALYELGLTCLGAKQGKRAADTFDRVLALDPDRLDAWLNLGVVCHDRLKDHARAARAYREYLRRGGTDPRVREWLSQVEKR
jgi:tetratricopeptide (TPR) repeat protein